MIQARQSAACRTFGSLRSAWAEGACAYAKSALSESTSVCESVCKAPLGTSTLLVLAASHCALPLHRLPFEERQQRGLHLPALPPRPVRLRLLCCSLRVAPPLQHHRIELLKPRSGPFSARELRVPSHPFTLACMNCCSVAVMHCRSQLPRRTRSSHQMSRSGTRHGGMSVRATSFSLRRLVLKPGAVVPKCAAALHRERVAQCTAHGVPVPVARRWAARR